MSYRNQTIRPILRPCTECADDESGACPRCDRPLCHAHALPQGTLCDTCEKQALGKAPWFAVVVTPLVIIGGMLGLSVAHTLHDDATLGWQLFAAVHGAGFVAGAFAVVTHWINRRRFSGERRPRRWPTRAQLETDDGQRAAASELPSAAQSAGATS